MSADEKTSTGGETAGDIGERLFLGERKRAFLNAEDKDKPLISPVPDAVLEKALSRRLAACVSIALPQ